MTTSFIYVALKQDFALIHGGWNTAAKLGIILCQSCAGLDLPEVKDFKGSFLPDVVENVLTLAAKLLDFYMNTELVSEKLERLLKSFIIHEEKIEFL